MLTLSCCWDDFSSKWTQQSADVIKNAKIAIFHPPNGHFSAPSVQKMTFLSTLQASPLPILVSLKKLILSKTAGISKGKFL